MTKERKKQAKEILNSKGFVTTVKAVVIILLLVVTAVALIWFVPWIPKLNDPVELEAFRQQLDSFQPFSWLILLGIQLLQVVIAIIPGEPIELLAGVLCGTWGGVALCLVGVLIGSIGIYYLVRWLGRSFIEKIFAKEKVRNFKLLSDARNLDLLVFLLFFIPGTPKDLLTYMVPLTPIKPIRFFLISTLARIPSVVTSTYAGAHLQQGDLQGAVVMYIIAAVLGIGGLVFYHSLNKKKAAKEVAASEEDKN